MPIVDVGSFVFGAVAGAAFSFLAVTTWALCAAAKMGDEGAGPPIHVGDVHLRLDAEADQYMRAETLGRDLPPGA